MAGETLVNITFLGTEGAGGFTLQDQVNALLAGSIGLPIVLEGENGEILFSRDDNDEIILTKESSFEKLMSSDKVYGTRTSDGQGIVISLFASSYINMLYIKVGTEQRERIYLKFFAKKIRKTVNSIVLELSKSGGDLAIGSEDEEQTAITVDSKKELISTFYTNSENQSKIVSALAGKGLETYRNDETSTLGIKDRSHRVPHSRMAFVLWVANRKEGLLGTEGKFSNFPPLKSSNKVFETYNEEQFGMGRFSANAVLTIDSFFEATGFEEFIKEQDGWFELEVDNFSALIDKENAVSQKIVNRGLANARLGGTTPSKLSEEAILARNQCALMTDLLHKGWTYTEYPKTWTIKARGATDSQGEAVTLLDPFYGRIYPIAIDDGKGGYSPTNEPQTIMNAFNVGNNDEEYFKSADMGSNEMFWELYWVYLDGLGGVQEQKIFKSGNDYENYINNPGAGGTTRFSIDNFYDEGGELITDENGAINFQKNVVNYVMSQIEVKFEGTNPATAKRDLQATLTINLPSLRGIDSICSVLNFTGLNEDGVTADVTKYLKIYELVTAPTVQSNETERLPNASLKNSYNADFFRLRMKMWAGGAKDNAIIVDLTTVDHSITRNDDILGSSVMTINYRGYFEGLLSNQINSATSGRETVKLTLEADKKMKALMEKKGCTEDAISKLALANKTLIESSAIKDLREGQIFIDLYRNGKFYKYTVDQDSIEVNTYLKGVDPRNKYTIGNFENIGKERARKDLAALEGLKEDFDALKYLKEYSGASAEGQGIGSDIRETLGILRNQGYCIMLGDFLSIIIDNLYQELSSEPADHMKQAPLKFIMSPIRVPNPKAYRLTNVNTQEQPDFIINPVQIPLSVAYLSDWFETKYVAPERVNVSINEFLSDLIGDLINKLIFENCFRIISEEVATSAPQFSSTQLVSHQPNWWKYRDDGWFDLSEIGGLNNAKRMKVDAGNSDIKNAKNYYIFYQSNTSISKKRLNNPDEKDIVIPTLYYGSNFADLNYCSDVSFAKTDVEYLREARYFNSGMGNLSLLSNVYDLSFSFDSQKATTVFYPGNVINFILTDWAGPSKYLPGRALGESDPHVKGRIANILGFGGYYIITRVTYTISSKSSKDFVIKIDTKFNGTDAERLEIETVENKKAKPVAIPPECLDIINDQIAKANEAVRQIDGANTIGYEFDGDDEETPVEQQDNKPDDAASNSEERVNEIPEGVGVLDPNADSGPNGNGALLDPEAQVNPEEQPFSLDPNDYEEAKVEPPTPEQATKLGIPKVTELARSLTEGDPLVPSITDTIYVDAQSPGGDSVESTDGAPGVLTEEDEWIQDLFSDSEGETAPATQPPSSPPAATNPPSNQVSSSTLNSTDGWHQKMLVVNNNSDYAPSEATGRIVTINKKARNDADPDSLVILLEASNLYDTGRTEDAVRAYGLSDQEVEQVLKDLAVDDSIVKAIDEIKNEYPRELYEDGFPKGYGEFVSKLGAAGTDSEREDAIGEYVQNARKDAIDFINKNSKANGGGSYSPSDPNNLTSRDIQKANENAELVYDEKVDESTKEINKKKSEADKAIKEAETTIKKAKESGVDTTKIEKAVEDAKEKIAQIQNPSSSTKDINEVNKAAEQAVQAIAELKETVEQAGDTTTKEINKKKKAIAEPPKDEKGKPIPGGTNSLYSYLEALKRAPLNVKATIPATVDLKGLDLVSFKLVSSNDGGIRKFHVYSADGTKALEIEIKD
jgi:hypothetical protein